MANHHAIEEVTIRVVRYTCCYCNRSWILNQELPAGVNQVACPYCWTVAGGLPKGKEKCNKHLAEISAPYPRTCESCGMGPCNFIPMED